MNTSGEKQDKSKKSNVEKAMYRVVDHVVIKDKKTGKQILNRRG